MFNHEQPLSLDHWMANVQGAAFVYSFYSAGAAGAGATAGRIATPKGASKSGVNITNDILGKPRVGSALKLDDYHAFNNIVDNYAGAATKTGLNNGADLYQLGGALNGVSGRFEWITQGGNVTHRMFVPGGTMNGVPIIP